MARYSSAACGTLALSKCERLSGHLEPLWVQTRNVDVARTYRGPLQRYFRSKTLLTTYAKANAALMIRISQLTLTCLAQLRRLMLRRPQLSSQQAAQ